ncbi:hypothetical protein HYS31_04120 [Candidatus Woesearchaeota archaeon]|nr:hypothetical protein [Candidatus Woesearchaeota archaeon]
MAKIHWLIYFIVGLFVSIASWKLDYEKFIFFFYTGWIFVSIGVIKLIYGILMNKKPELTKAHRQPKPVYLGHQQGLKRCQECGNIMKVHDRFCSRCGARN